MRKNEKDIIKDDIMVLGVASSEHCVVYSE